MLNEYLMYGGVGAAVLLIGFLALKDSLYPYVPAGPLFTKAELNFYHYLTKAVSGRALVFGKVRIADVIQPKPSIKGSKRTTALNKIAQKHFDYVLVHPETMEILAAVELNDKSHERKDRTARDKLVRDAMKSCDIPFIEVPAGKSYDLVKLFALLAPALDFINPHAEQDKPAVTPLPHKLSEKTASETSLDQGYAPASTPMASQVSPNPDAQQVSADDKPTPTPAALPPESVLKKIAKPYAETTESPVEVVPEEVPAIFSREAIAQMEKEESISTCDMRVHNG